MTDDPHASGADAVDAGASSRSVPRTDGGRDRDADCPFCAVVAGEAPAYVVHETDAAVAFLDVEPISRGHTLVVPKTHRATLTDCSAEEVAALFRAVREVAAAVERGVDADGFNLLQANGEHASQDVFHVHVHVVPREAGDGRDFENERSALDDLDPEATAAAIRDAAED